MIPAGIGSANTQVTLLRVDSEQLEVGRSGGHSLEVLVGNSGDLRQKGRKARWRARDLPGSVQESKTLPLWEPSLPDCSDCGSLALSTLLRAAPAPKGRPLREKRPRRRTTPKCRRPGHAVTHVDRKPHRRRDGDDATCSEERKYHRRCDAGEDKRSSRGQRCRSSLALRAAVSIKALSPTPRLS